MKIASILWRVSLAVLLGVLSWSVYTASIDIRMLVTAARYETASLRINTVQQEAIAVQLLDNSLNRLLRDVTETRLMVDRQLNTVQSTLRDTSDSLTADVHNVATSVGSLEVHTSAMLDNTATLLQTTDNSVAMITPQLLGAVAAAKRAAGETAQAAIRIDAALPQFLVRWDEISANAARATNEYAETGVATRTAMRNLADATKPLPKWVRYTFGVAGQVAPVAAGAAATAAAVGAFQ